MKSGFLIIFAACVLDLFLGDPQVSWHPVRIIGRFIARLEKILNKGRLNRRWGGVILVVLAALASGFTVVIVLKLSLMAGSWLFYAVSVLLVYFAVSIRALSDEAEKIRRSLEEGDLVNARNDLAMIVGRDTGGLDAPEVTRAAVETVAESTMDGIVAPLFYAFLGGPVLLWVYKTVNTLDSMVGYKNARFKEFGWAAARVDGWMNLIPSKITSLLISAAMLFCGRNFWGAAKRACGYIFKGPAVNSQGVEDAMAGGLDVRLGGRSFYQGEPEDKPLLGETSNPLNLSHIRQAVTVSYIASALMLAGGLVILRGYC